MSNTVTSQKSHPASREKPVRRYTLLVPFLIIVVSLIASAVRETVAVHKQKINLEMQSQQSVEILERSSKQVAAVLKLKKDLEALAAVDPVAAKIFADYFPMASSPTQNPLAPAE